MEENNYRSALVEKMLRAEGSNVQDLNEATFALLELSTDF